MERELRRHQNTLVIIGSGVIMFGLWSVIKTIAFSILNREEVLQMVSGGVALSETDQKVYLLIYYIFMAILLLIDLSFRVYVGRSARREGRGRKRKRDGVAYLVIAALIALFCVIGTVADVMEILDLSSATDNILSLLVSVFIDVTSFITMVELIRAAVRSRQIKRALKGVSR